MIYAEALKIDDCHLRLVINYPDGHKKEPLTVADEGEAKRLVYFYNRLYICDTLKAWLRHRVAVYNHVNALPAAAIAENLLEVISNFGKTSLNQVCKVVVQQAGNINAIAPGNHSRFHNRFIKEIQPILLFCHEMEGVEA